MLSLRSTMIAAVVAFVLMSAFLLIQHEVTVMLHPQAVDQQPHGKATLVNSDRERLRTDQTETLGKLAGARANRLGGHTSRRSKIPEPKASPITRGVSASGSTIPTAVVPTSGYLRFKDPQEEKIKKAEEREHKQTPFSSEGNDDEEDEATNKEKGKISSTLGNNAVGNVAASPVEARPLVSQPEQQKPSPQTLTQTTVATPSQAKDQSKLQSGSQRTGSSGETGPGVSPLAAALHAAPKDDDDEARIEQKALQGRDDDEPGSVRLHPAHHSTTTTIADSSSITTTTAKGSNTTTTTKKRPLPASYAKSAQETTGAKGAPAVVRPDAHPARADAEREVLAEQHLEQKELELNNDDQRRESSGALAEERRGLLTCNGTAIDSEVIYWKLVPGDSTFESPITPHHSEHADRFLTFEYDAGGWNNIRMSLECMIVVAHAMGRTLIVPPQEHLYLLGKRHQDEEDAKPHDEMGFEDFFDLDLLESHQGFHMMHMEDFLEQVAMKGGLKGQLPPGMTKKLTGGKLWTYLRKVADDTPIWFHRFLAFPAQPGDFNLTQSFRNQSVTTRMKAFQGDRKPIFYDVGMQRARHLHIPSDPKHRILQHHYAFAFFADPELQSFYRRFVRDFMRYKDRIQCGGHELVAAVRADALREAPQFGGEYYALHVRRGDFQYKDVKISAQEILDNMKFRNGTPIIPAGALVYISTDDPDGQCRNCFVKGKACSAYESPKPVGCPEDTSWAAFEKAGWKLRFLKNYLSAGLLQRLNPNTHGMVESIVCSRAKVFAGTFFSTFTGYIHRLRGYHGRGEDSYYHSTQYVHQLQMKRSVGQGWPREWRAGWTDDGGGLI